MAVVGVGILLLPLPGPGWVVIFLGLSILAAEFPRAQRILTRALGYYERIKQRALRRRDGRPRVK